VLLFHNRGLRLSTKLDKPQGRHNDNNQPWQKDAKFELQELRCEVHCTRNRLVHIEIAILS
ncbi:MAG: hypothetical protein RL386_1393, partial [Bacteroidota bacterium]|jgi:hypothetical protein